MYQHLRLKDVYYERIPACFLHSYNHFNSGAIEDTDHRYVFPEIIKTIMTLFQYRNNQPNSLVNREPETEVECSIIADVVLLFDHCSGNTNDENRTL